MSDDTFLEPVLPGPADVERVLELARRAHLLGSALVDCASRARSTGSTDWRSVAAQAFRAELAAGCRAVETCADTLDDAAAALRRHARTSEQRLPG